MKRLRKTTEKFINQAIEKHGNTYDYSETVYNGGHVNLNIICRVHGPFKQTASTHLQGAGCAKCGIIKNHDSNRVTNDIFIDKAKKIHGNKYDYSLVEYKNNRTKVVIKCPIHDKFEKSPSDFLQGHGCQKCGREQRIKSRTKTLEEFIEESKKLHDGKYDYSLVDYKTIHTKVKIICPEHDVFEQTPSGHLSGHGCVKCSINDASKRSSMHKDEFIQRSKLIHGDKYIYSKVEYKNANIKVKIICKNHWIFMQTPAKHMSGQGCKKCYNDNRPYNSTGWSVSTWEKIALKSKYFDSFKVYVIRCFNDNESFFKIGRTFRKTKERFAGKNNIPYKYEVVKEFVFDTAKEAFDKETILQHINKKHRYIPNISFSGENECFYRLDKIS